MDIQLMNPLFTKLRPKLTLTIVTSTLQPFTTSKTSNPVVCSDKKKSSKVRVKATTNQATATKLKENWLDSLSSPLSLRTRNFNSCNDSDSAPMEQSSNWVIGIDPDLSGAIAVLKPQDDSGFCSQVFDNPHLKVMVGKNVRKRLDARSIVQLLQSFNAPIGTTAFLEQSIPFPTDGKQGWWNGGFGYGLWIGVLVASGFSVVPVPSFTWKNEFELANGTSTKDDSRRVASTLFPSLSSMLERKKDHGRAEALLIAAYGKALKAKSGTSVLEEVP